MAPEITEEGFTGEGDRGPSESRPGVRQCEAGPGTGEGDSSADTRLSCGNISQVRIEDPGSSSLHSQL